MRWKEKEKVFTQLTPDGILSAGKENLAILWSEVTKVEVRKEWVSNIGGFTSKWGWFKVFTADKKYGFGQVKGRMLGEFWHILNLTVPDKVTVPKDREKFEKEVLKLENTPVDVLCAHLRSLGFEAEICGLEEEDKKFLAYLDKAVVEIKGRNIASIIYQRMRLNWGIWCVLKNVAGKWEYTQTKERGKQDFEWVADRGYQLLETYHESNSAWISGHQKELSRLFIDLKKYHYADSAAQGHYIERPIQAKIFNDKTGGSPAEDSDYSYAHRI